MSNCFSGLSKSLPNMLIIVYWLQNVFKQLSTHFNSISTKFQSLHMIFNTSQRTIKLSSAWDMLKIKWKNWNIIVMQTQYLTAVEKHLASNGKKRLLALQIDDSENHVFTAFRMFFNSCQMVYLHHNTIHSHDFQHILKTCQTQSSLRCVENHNNHNNHNHTGFSKSVSNVNIVIHRMQKQLIQILIVLLPWYHYSNKARIYIFMP